MTKYKVPMVFVFNGFAIVEANDEDEAEQIALWDMSATLGEVSNDGNDKITNYEFEVNGCTEPNGDEVEVEVEVEDEIF